MFADQSLFSPREIEQAAQGAIQAPAPASGDKYDFVEQAKKRAKTKDHGPFNQEQRRGKIGVVVATASGCLALLFLGWTNLTAIALILSAFAAYVGAYEAWFKRWPHTVTYETIDAAKKQQEEAGEADQEVGSVISKVAYGGLCLADGAMTGTALAERIGQASLTPRMAVFIGVIVSIALAAALFAVIKAAAREAKKADARKKIRNLQLIDPDKSKPMEARVGNALEFGYGTRDDSTKARVWLIGMTIGMAAIQFIMRLGAFAGEDGSGMANIMNLAAAVGISCLIFCTVAGMYITERRHAFLDPDSAMSKIVLAKFPDHASLDKHLAAHDGKVHRELQDTVLKFAEIFDRERKAMNIAKAHPLPTL